MDGKSNRAWNCEGRANRFVAPGIGEIGVESDRGRSGGKSTREKCLPPKGKRPFRDHPLHLGLSDQRKFSRVILLVGLAASRLGARSGALLPWRTESPPVLTRHLGHVGMVRFNGNHNCYVLSLFARSARIPADKWIADFARRPPAQTPEELGELEIQLH